MSATIPLCTKCVESLPTIHTPSSRYGTISTRSSRPIGVEEFDDIHGLIERFHSLADLYQNVINDLIEGYISLNAHHLNQIMKVLTIVTVIFVPLTLLVGIYGMNFEYIPELKSEHGYFVLLGAMVAIALGLLMLFRRFRWL